MNIVATSQNVELNRLGGGVIMNDRLVDIFLDTQELSQTEFADDTAECIKNTVVYTNTDKLKAEKSYGDTKITLVRGGTVNTAYKYAHHYRTAMLNFADALTPGGMVMFGSRCQEEGICRCTNLYSSLTTPIADKFYYKANYESGIRHYLDNIIYTPQVRIFKDDTTYELLTDAEYADVITCPAP